MSLFDDLCRRSGLGESAFIHDREHLVLTDGALALACLTQENFLHRSPAIFPPGARTSDFKAIHSNLVSFTKSCRMTSEGAHIRLQQSMNWPADARKLVLDAIMLPSLAASVGRDVENVARRKVSREHSLVGRTLRLVRSARNRFARIGASPRGLEESDTVLAAARMAQGGSASVASLLTSMVHYSALHPDSAIENSTRSILNETLRSAPPAWLIVREIANRSAAPDALLPFLSADVNSIAICTYLIHRDTRYWEDPERWMPSRWITADRNPPSFIPFGAGVERCIGQGIVYAVAEAVYEQIRHQIPNLRITNAKRFSGGPLYAASSFSTRVEK
ncbi:cytochrome P450 [Arthrobacter tumbae]|uniref:cytochrome P450 n=1 Tax=Arthrobacter tumbae TaxID=163874 RepID=UPI003557EDDE|nr:hypothetical protein [Arthrobacter tumbae]